MELWRNKMNKIITPKQFAKDVLMLTDKIVTKHYEKHEREAAKVMLLNSLGSLMFCGDKKEVGVQ
jgi:hypothetical protein